MIAELATESYDVPRSMVLERLKLSRWTLLNYEHHKMIPPARRRPGVRGKFYTEAQVNNLFRRLGRTDRIKIED